MKINLVNLNILCIIMLSKHACTLTLYSHSNFDPYQFAYMARLLCTIVVYRNKAGFLSKFLLAHSFGM